MQQRKKILYASLLPSYFGERREDCILTGLVEEYLAGYQDKYELMLLLASAHQSALDQVQSLLKPYGLPSRLVLCPFENRPEFNERRAHEIAFSKRHMASLWRSEPYEYLMHLDADVAVPFADLDVMIGGITQPMEFINIPYSIKEAKTAPDVQFGAYIHTRELNERIDYSASMYRTFERHGKVYRVGAPDCEARNGILAHGGRERRAKPPAFRITTHHYNCPHTYRKYKAGRISIHKVMAPLIGFDPEIDTMSMDFEACVALHAFCGHNRIKRVLNLGTGTGNSVRAALFAGAETVVSVDQHEKFSRLVEGELAREHPGLRCLTRPVVQQDGAALYDLADAKDVEYDLAIVDGPEKHPSARIASALIVKARHYIFHDAHRDAEGISRFVQQLRRRSRRCEATYLDIGRKLSLVSAT